MNNRVLHPGIDFLLLVTGALTTLCFAPFDYWWAAVPLLSILLAGCEQVSPRRAALRGALFGLGLYSTGIYWIYISLHDYGHAPVAFAALATFAVVLLMLCYCAVFSYGLACWGAKAGAVKYLLLAPAWWGLLEWLRSWLFTGFPWLSLGYSQLTSPLSGLAPYFGVFGVGWAVLFSAGALLLLARAGSRGIALSALVLVWLGTWQLARMSWTTPVGGSVQVALLQGNIPQEEKFTEEGIVRTLRWYAERSYEQSVDTDVVIWPETAIPIFYQDLPQDYIAGLLEWTNLTDTTLLTGVPTGSWETRQFFNSVVSLGSDDIVVYHKRRLLPFGEYVPLRFLLNFFHDFVDIPMADFTAGESVQALPQAGGHPVGVSICFEAAFGSEIRMALPEAHYLVNVSNDAWFGYSLAPYQHLQIARMRALEAERYLARATNTGISAIVDSRGRILKQSDLFTGEVISGEIQPLAGATPYVRFGDGAVVSLLLLLLGAGWLLRWRPLSLAKNQDAV